MTESVFLLISAIFLSLFELLFSVIKIAISNWGSILMVLILIFIIRELVERINSLNTKVDNLTSLINQEVNQIIDNRFNYSLTNIYNEKELLGNEWTYKIDEGHWATSVYDDTNGKFIVKHFRTQRNIEENNYEKRLFDDMAHNKEFIYGDDRKLGNVNGMEKLNGIYVPKK